MVQPHGLVLLDKHLCSIVRRKMRGLQLLLAEGILPMFFDVLQDSCPLIGVSTGCAHWVHKELLGQGASQIVRSTLLALQFLWAYCEWHINHEAKLLGSWYVGMVLTQPLVFVRIHQGYNSLYNFYNLVCYTHYNFEVQ